MSSIVTTIILIGVVVAMAVIHQQYTLVSVKHAAAIMTITMSVAVIATGFGYPTNTGWMAVWPVTAMLVFAAVWYSLAYAIRPTGRIRSQR